MDMPGYQDLMKRRTDESEKMSAKAAEAFNEGYKANRISDTYSLFAVLFSMVMFLAAITTKLVRQARSYCALGTYLRSRCSFSYFLCAHSAQGIIRVLQSLRRDEGGIRNSKNKSSVRKAAPFYKIWLITDFGFNFM
jgi:hypothetical protein